ncbi:UNKNOWN [Stylonychia lemnae]|uniref:Uncharacterized protein n=1 Tax=Stylonychia lemnae TaxID=5949 RepID=A0A078AFG8_STYLE|nr:UNKNOWN [Stylonychia lemnae]|eukprot:CDW80267.1 UNKNOWN [Stylonychia lemnae]
MPLIKKENFKDFKNASKQIYESPFLIQESSNTTLTNNQIETAATMYGGSIQGPSSNSGFETPARQTRETRDSNEFTSISSQQHRNQSRESALAGQYIDNSQIFPNQEASQKNSGNKFFTKQEILYESKESQSNQQNQDQARKTHFQVQNRESQALLQIQQNSNLFMTMRAYNMKKGRRSSNSYQSNASSSSRAQEEQDNAGTENMEDKFSNAGTLINSSLMNSEKIAITNETSCITSSDPRMEMKVNSKQTGRVVPQVLGINVQKFPPGFFSENMMDTRQRKQKSIDRINNQNLSIKNGDSNSINLLSKIESQKELSNFLNSEMMPIVKEMPSLKEVRSEKILNPEIQKAHRKLKIIGKQTINSDLLQDMNNQINSSATRSLINQSRFDQTLNSNPSSIIKFDVNQQLKIHKVKSEPNLKKYSKAVKTNLPPLINKNFFTANQDNQQSLKGFEDQLQIINLSGKSNTKLIAIPKMREASQQEQVRPYKYQEPKPQYRQQSAPMPPEAMLKKKDEKDINNFLDGNDFHKIQMTITRKDDNVQSIFKNQKIFKNPVITQNDNSQNKYESLSKIIDNSKFLSRIQEKNSSYFPLSKQTSPKYNNMPALITIHNKVNNINFNSNIGGQQIPLSEQNSLKNLNDINQILLHQKQIKKILLGSNSQQALQNSKTIERDQETSRKQIKKINIKPQKQRLLPSLRNDQQQFTVKDNNEPQNLPQMLTTFGPTQNQPSKLSIFQQQYIGNAPSRREQSLSSNEETKTPLHVNQQQNSQQDDVEMTFGFIGHSNMGNTVSSSMMRESTSGYSITNANNTNSSQNKVFGTTFLKSLQETSNKTHQQQLSKFNKNEISSINQNTISQ